MDESHFQTARNLPRTTNKHDCVLGKNKIPLGNGIQEQSAQCSLTEVAQASKIASEDKNLSLVDAAQRGIKDSAIFEAAWLGSCW